MTAVQWSGELKAYILYVPMCGINGFLGSDSALLARMNECIAHRGPDFQGSFVDADISLGHNLLAIRE